MSDHHEKRPRNRKTDSRDEGGNTASYGSLVIDAWEPLHQLETQRNPIGIRPLLM